MKTLSELEKQHPEETLAARDEQIKELMASAERTAEHVANVLADADARAERQAARIAELEARLALAKDAYIDLTNSEQLEEDGYVVGVICPSSLLSRFEYAFAGKRESR